MNRFGQWCLVVLFWVAVFAPARGVGDYVKCPDCKKDDAPVDKWLQLGFTPTNSTQPPLKLKEDDNSSSTNRNIELVDLARPNNTGSVKKAQNPHEQSDEFVKDAKAVVDAKPADIANKMNSFEQTYESNLKGLCAKAFNNMRYDRFCGVNGCKDFDQLPKGVTSASCSATTAGVGHRDPTTIDGWQIETKIEKKSIRLSCKVPEDPCDCHYKTPTDSNCANLSDSSSHSCNAAQDPVAQIMSSDGSPKDTNLDNLITDSSAPKE